MISLLANHLWQSTVFALAAGLLTFGFRRQRAQVRYGIWLAASLKFLVPFFLLAAAGSHVHWAGSAAVQQVVPGAVSEISEPFQPRPMTIVVNHDGAGPSRPLLRVILSTVWFCGFAGLLVVWYARWHRVRIAMRNSRALDSGMPIETRCSASVIEPGVFGLFRPVLLMPEGITQRLTPEQFAAIVAHEMCHVRRRDNLAAAFHMAAEAIFWFHPVVWWIGARLVEERERACDEEVLRMGNDPQVYAEGILNVCKFYVESPLTCVAGITGADLKKRIEVIMTNRILGKLNFGRKMVLAAAGCMALAAPVLMGIVNAPRVQAQNTASVAFEVVSVKPNKSTELRRARMESQPGGKLTYTNVPLRVIITEAFNLPFQAPERVSGAPAWINSERFDIEARAADGAIAAGLPEKIRNDKMMLMLQAVLADRFQLKTHWETKQLPVYSLAVSKDGLKLPKAKMEEKDCPEVSSAAGYCHMLAGGQGQGFHGRTFDMSDLVTAMENFTDRPVIDNTGLKGLFDIDTEGWVPMRQRPGPPPGAEPSAEDKAFADPGRPTLPSLLHKVGIEMESTRGPVQVLVIDRVERPSEN